MPSEKTSATFFCPLDYGREMEECVRDTLDIYCAGKGDRPRVRMEIRGKGKKGIVLKKGWYRKGFFS